MQIAKPASRGSSSRPFSLAQVRTLLMDMDGVIYFDSTILPHIGEFLSFLSAAGIRCGFLTNGTTRRPEEHRAALAARGINIDGLPIYSAGMATAEYLAQTPGARVYAIGEKGFLDQLVEIGRCVLDDTRPDYVVVGWSDDFDYQQLFTCCRAIYRGARLIVADPDVNDPAPEGPTPGAGAFAAAIQAATGVAPFLSVGKPNRAIFQMALRGLGADPESSAIVGDRLDSDVCGGLQAGIGAIVVLTGITTPAMLAASPLKPHLVVRDLQELRILWERELQAAPLHSRPT